MTQLTIQLPETVFSILQKNPEEFTREMRLTAAVKWYELGQVSQERAAEIAGLSRAEFIRALSRFQERVVVNASPLITLFRSD